MLSGKSITAFETLQLFGCLRLAAMIHNIRKTDYSLTKATIETEDQEMLGRELPLNDLLK
jgi:hypothetical protein